MVGNNIENSLLALFVTESIAAGKIIVEISEEKLLTDSIHIRGDPLHFCNFVKRFRQVFKK